MNIQNEEQLNDLRKQFPLCNISECTKKATKYFPFEYIGYCDADFREQLNSRYLRIIST